jgi:hypothetical protein
VLVYAIAVVAALAIPLLTRGSYGRALGVRWRFVSVLVAGLAIQIVLEYATIPRDHWHDVGFGLLVASYVLILAFAARNLVLRGMGIVLIGIACNALVITLNQGMPVKIPADWQTKSWAQPTVKHHPQQPDDKLRFLSDIIVLRRPFQSVMSFGDLILAVGICDVAYNASRKPKRRGARASRGSGPLDLTKLDEPEPDPEPYAEVAVAPAGAARQEEEPTRSRRTRSRATTTRSS